MTAIWPAGPPKLMKPSFSQNQNASLKGIARAAGLPIDAADAGAWVMSKPLLQENESEQALDADASWVGGEAAHPHVAED
jgi:hypothetical protein